MSNSAPQATWHPNYDLVLVGRYPDQRFCSNDSRTIDVYDGNSAELLVQLQVATATGIKSVSLSAHLSAYLSAHLSVCLSMYLYLSV